MRSSSEMTPSSISTTRSARATASCTSCVTSKAVKPSRCHKPSISSCISIRVKASSAPRGSSSSSKRGRCTKARASATRWRWPPDSCAGQSAVRSPRPTFSSTSRACSVCPAGRPSATLSSTFFQGSKRASWNMMRASSCDCAPDCATGAPSINTSPADGDSKPAIRRSKVLLPQPLRPTMATNSPGSITRLLPCSTERSP